jgi:hypothetical protein
MHGDRNIAKVYRRIAAMLKWWKRHECLTRKDSSLQVVARSSLSDFVSFDLFCSGFLAQRSLIPSLTKFHSFTFLISSDLSIFLLFPGHNDSTCRDISHRERAICISDVSLAGVRISA